MSPFQSSYDNKWPSQNFYQMHFKKIWGVWGMGGRTLWSLWILKRALELLITIPMSPSPSKFIQSPFLYLYLICPQDITWTLAPENCGGGVILKDIISGPFNYIGKNGYFKILIRCGEMGGMGGGLLPSNHFWLLTKALAFSISNGIELFLEFLGQQMAISKFLSNTFWENPRCEGGYLPSSPLES